MLAPVPDSIKAELLSQGKTGIYNTGSAVHAESKQKYK
jgi:hypothetical protein